MIQEPNSDQTLESRLYEALEMTFPASDPIAVHLSDPAPLVLRPPGRPAPAVQSVQRSLPQVNSNTEASL